jgi:double-stranded uracil-DNA glycosylase
VNCKLRDRVRPPVRVLFVGINPGIRSAATGHHFAGYSNRFWRLLYESGLVPEPIGTEDDGRLPEWGFGITNLVPRATPGIDTLGAEEYVTGLRALRRKVRRWKPEVVALVGVTLYRAIYGKGRGKGRPTPFPGAFPSRFLGNPTRTSPGRAGWKRRPTPFLGLQPQQFEGADVFVLPNPSGRNANFSYAEMLDAFRALNAHLRPTP